MVRVEEYPQLVEKIIREYGQYKPFYGDVDVQLIFDRENHHYQLMNVGWNGTKRVRGSVLHIDIIDGKIWIQHDGTETGVANQLVEMGVPKDDIVLAFHAPNRRAYTGFATS